MDRIPMTREGYEKLRAELEHLEKVRMPEVRERIAAARALGDLRENADYHAARELQGILQAKIDELRYKLSRADIVDKSNLPEGEVVFGARVRFRNLDTGEEDFVHIVGPGEEDYDNNKILFTSPLARGLMGKKVGDVAEIRVPAGLRRLEILEITIP
ncbi:MAG: transcription elongation factor GreA [Gemmatales bacterium]|nr:transcription elongation factor GreA [Gemmatales bacterium]MDW8175024.1 transcription elongation factor GreA [Gemmatales bacterium]